MTESNPWLELIEQSNILVEINAGCGHRGQNSIDAHWEKMHAFAATHGGVCVPERPVITDMFSSIDPEIQERRSKLNRLLEATPDREVLEQLVKDSIGAYVVTLEDIDNFLVECQGRWRELIKK